MHLTTEAQMSWRRQRRRFAGAMARLMLFAYSSITSTTFQLVHCVEVPAASGIFVLFAAGQQRCGGAWQSPLYAVAFGLVALPLAPLLVSATLRSRMAHPVAKRAARRLVNWGSQGYMLQAFKQTLTLNFRGQAQYWHAALTAQRVLMVAVENLSTDRILQSVAQALIIVIALSLQLLVQPFHNKDVNKLQTALCALLVLIAISSIPIRTLGQASVDTAETPALDYAVLLLENSIAVSSLLPVILQMLLVVLGLDLGTGMRAACYRALGVAR
jgi:hypothetical protein